MTRNTELLEKTMQWIQDHPEQHDQVEWAKRTDCGTAACFAGWSAILTYGRSVLIEGGGFQLPNAAYDEPMSEQAGRLLGLTYSEWETLFDANNTIEMLQLMVKDLVNGAEVRTCEDYEREAEAGVS